VGDEAAERHSEADVRWVDRFAPFEMSSEERASSHAADERMRESTFVSGTRFSRALIERL
jgi:carboxypeptidase PM20D1